MVRYLILLVFLGGWVNPAFAQERFSMDLGGTWQLQAEGSDEWQEVSVPGSFESQLDVDFNGVATYRRTVDAMELPENRRLIVHFDAIATHCTVSFNDVEVGQHLGGWTPFRFDVSDLARQKPEGPWEIRVRVDERVGHNTQGFLPIISPHFGGFWQSARLIQVPETWIDETGLHLQGDRDKRQLTVVLPWARRVLPDLTLEIRPSGQTEWTRLESMGVGDMVEREFETVYRGLWRIPETVELKNWTPDQPQLYEVKLRHEDLRSTDQIVTRFGFRQLNANRNGFLLNGKPVQFRGLLNWGYAPPRTAPSIDESFMQNEIEFAKARGFNLMKFCLWVPPKRYLELCDEMGMMAWIEYPAWHPDFSGEHLENLQREYGEFFQYDRNHPSVMLRSLTCETGPSAELSVIRALYNQCKAMIPGSIVVDDSSWIAWNRVFDFYDDHPYGNNHTWISELNRLRDFMRENKPLMLGEAITADTWTHPDWFKDNRLADAPHTWPNFLQASREWLKNAELLYGQSAIERLWPDSKAYAMKMRKYQMETFRRELPGHGYVVSVMRDMPLAAMGLIDYNGDPKWSAEDWRWHSDEMIVLRLGEFAEYDYQKAFTSGSNAQIELIGAGLPGNGWRCEWTLTLDDGTVLQSSGPSEIVPGKDEIGRSVWRVSAELPKVDRPTRLTLSAQCRDRESDRLAPVAPLAINQWDFWVIPELDIDSGSLWASDSFVEMENKPDCFANLSAKGPSSSQVGLTTRIDHEVLARLGSGERVVLLANNQPNSFPTQSHWFLRGGPVVAEDFERLFPSEFLVETQHFDMAADVIRDIQYLEAIDPLFMLWETHDLDHVKTNGLLFHVPVASGNLFVSSLNHAGSGHAGEYVLKRLVKEIIDGDICNQFADPERGQANLNRLRREIEQEKIMLDDMTWKFKPDPDQKGHSDEWFATQLNDSEWDPIRIDRHWESQGQDNLDHWGWYRLSVKVPESWDSPTTYLNFTGVDDYYDVYVNGHKVGSGGDIEKRETAFDLKSSHEISGQVEPGEELQITVAVYDWYGAGGIFRPAWISTQPISKRPRMLK